MYNFLTIRFVKLAQMLRAYWKCIEKFIEITTVLN